MRRPLRGHRPHLLIATLGCCLLVVVVLADSASRDSLFGIAVALVLVLGATLLIIRDVLAATDDSSDPRSAGSVSEDDVPKAG